MKKLTLSLCSIIAVASAAFAGPVSVRSSGKEVQQTAVETSSLFGEREWNVDLFGAYAYAPEGHRRELGRDHAFGGGFDVNYFFCRYLGVGLEGYGLNAAHDALGQASGNLIARYPIDRFNLAPYAYVGGGVLFNGSNVENNVSKGKIGTVDRGSNAEGVLQFGTGLEYRFTRHVGVMSDYSWNVVNGGKNNFGMVRTGIRFAF